MLYFSLLAIFLFFISRIFKGACAAFLMFASLVVSLIPVVFAMGGVNLSELIGSLNNDLAAVDLSVFSIALIATLFVITIG